MRPLSIAAAALATAFFAGSLSAQQTRPCTDEVYSAFDFWVGEWEVRLADGSLAGHNTIRKIAGGCGLAESWRGATGGTGESLNHHDPRDGRWHQLWVGSSGLVLRLAGGPVSGSGGGGMRMEGRAQDEADRHRITWTPLPDGRVRQVWETSGDGGESWSVVFDGYYERSR